MNQEDVALAGDGRTAVTRRGSVVFRGAGPWTRSVHALLNHLERAGFDEAPRVVGDGFDQQGREVLTFIEGNVVHPAPWSDDALYAFGAMLRSLHDATASFEPPVDALWQPWFGRTIGTPDVIGHCDAAPWNVVWRHANKPVLIDWEVAGPVDRLTEIAMAAWNGAQLYDDDVAAMIGLADPLYRMRQVRMFVDGYGLSLKQRKLIPSRIIEFASQSAANEVVEQNITPETTYAPRVWGIAWQTRSVAWLVRHRAALEAALA